MKVLIIPLTILIGILIVAGIILNNSSPISIPSLNNTSQTQVTGAVWKSIDGGRTFEPKSKVNGDGNISLSRNVIQLGHGNANDIFALTRTGGLFKSVNWGESWDTVFNSSIIANTFAASPNNSDDIYIGAIASKRARLYRTINGGKDAAWPEMYTEPKSGTAFVSIKVNPKNDNNIYGLLSNGILLKSYNKGLDWVLAYDFKTPALGLSLDKNNPDIVSAIGLSQLFVSQDGGFTFQASVPRLRERAVTGSQITSFAINQNDSQEIYIGSTGELIRTRDFGKTWENIRILTPNLSLPVNNVSVSLTDPNVIYYTVGSVLYTSSNRGESWNTSDLSSIVKNISTLLIDKQKSDILYIGTN
jgi:photosystem II stability/assembly factor-like uncharacterized protein